MLDYTKESLLLLNMKKVQLNEFAINSPKVFEIEKTLSVDEKIKFIDKNANNIATFMIDLIKKWESDKDGLPQDNYGRPKTVSKKAWLKRNDNRGVVDKEFKIGSFYVFGSKFKEMTLTCPQTEHGYNMTYSGDSIVHQWFHDLLKRLYDEELLHFNATDSRMIKLNQLKEKLERYGNVFTNKELNDIKWNGKTDVSEKHLDVYLKAYQELEASIINIQGKLFETLGE